MISQVSQQHVVFWDLQHDFLMNKQTESDFWIFRDIILFLRVGKNTLNYTLEN